MVDFRERMAEVPKTSWLFFWSNFVVCVVLTVAGIGLLIPFIVHYLHIHDESAMNKWLLVADILYNAPFLIIYTVCIGFTALAIPLYRFNKFLIIYTVAMCLAAVSSFTIGLLTVMGTGRTIILSRGVADPKLAVPAVIWVSLAGGVLFLVQSMGMFGLVVLARVLYTYKVDEKFDKSRAALEKARDSKIVSFLLNVSQVAFLSVLTCFSVLQFYATRLVAPNEAIWIVYFVIFCVGAGIAIAHSVVAAGTMLWQIVSKQHHPNIPRYLGSSHGLLALMYLFVLAILLVVSVTHALLNRTTEEIDTALQVHQMLGLWGALVLFETLLSAVGVDCHRHYKEATRKATANSLRTQPTITDDEKA